MSVKNIRAVFKEVADDFRSPITSDDVLVIGVSLCLLMVPVGIIGFGG